MKNFKVILLVALGLMVFSGQVFAEDLLGSLRTQIQSGLTGLRTGDYAGVASGVRNFALGTAVSGMNTLVSLPGLSQVYGAGQSTRLQLNNIYSGLSSSYAAGGFTGVGRYSLGLGASGIDSIYSSLRNNYSTGMVSGVSDLRRLAAGVSGSGAYGLRNAYSAGLGAGQWTRQQLANVGVVKAIQSINVRRR